MFFAVITLATCYFFNVPIRGFSGMGRSFAFFSISQSSIAQLIFLSRLNIASYVCHYLIFNSFLNIKRHPFNVLPRGQSDFQVVQASSLTCRPAYKLIILCENVTLFSQQSMKSLFQCLILNSLLSNI